MNKKLVLGVAGAVAVVGLGVLALRKKRGAEEEVEETTNEATDEIEEDEKDIYAFELTEAISKYHLSEEDLETYNTICADYENDDMTVDETIEALQNLLTKLQTQNVVAEEPVSEEPVVEAEVEDVVEVETEVEEVQDIPVEEVLPEPEQEVVVEQPSTEEPVSEEPVVEAEVKKPARKVNKDTKQVKSSTKTQKKKEEPQEVEETK